MRRAVAQRYRFVLIDEFQDTDPLQAELAALLAASVEPAGRAWHEIDVEPGRLFFVGDPKQSIYRFRRADLLLYHRAAARFGEHAVELATNFRSTPGVLAWVNDVFDGLLRDSAADIQAAPARLEPHREPLVDHPFDGPPVATFGEPRAETAAELRLREAGDVAALVRSIVGRWRVVDPRHGTARPARARDIAILLPTRLALDAIDRALDDADIAARVESRSLVFATSEVRDLLAILQAIDDPADALAVVAALRSPGFACSDSRARRVGFGRRPLGLPGRAARVHRRRARRRRRDAAIPRAARRARLAFGERHRRGRDRRLRARRARTGAPPPRDRWRRTRFLLEHAAQLGRRGQRRDAARLRRMGAPPGRRAGDGHRDPAPELDDDAVRILTMHGAKGLEFPIVILGGLAATPPTGPSEVLFDDSGPLLRAGHVGLEIASAGYAAQRDREREHVAAERARLLYVAATRARDHLLVSQHYNPQRQNTSFAAMLAAHLDRHPVPVLAAEAAAGARRRHRNAHARARVGSRRRR